MPHARGCLSDCRLRSCSSDTDLNSTKQLCGSLCLSSFPPSSVQRTQTGFACLKPHALLWKHTMTVFWQCRTGFPIPQRWYLHGVYVCAQWCWRRSVFRAGAGWNLHKGALCRREFSWARDLGVESFGWISQDSSERREISLSLEKKRHPSSFSSLFHDKNQQF